MDTERQSARIGLSGFIVTIEEIEDHIAECLYESFKHEVMELSVERERWELGVRSVVGASFATAQGVFGPVNGVWWISFNYVGHPQNLIASVDSTVLQLAVIWARFARRSDLEDIKMCMAGHLYTFGDKGELKVIETPVE